MSTSARARTPRGTEEACTDWNASRVTGSLGTLAWSLDRGGAHEAAIGVRESEDDALRRSPRVGQRPAVLESRVPLHGRVQQADRRVHRPRRAVDQFKSSEPGSGNDMTYSCASEGPAGAAEGGRLGRNVELRASPDVLARADALRQRVVARVHEDLHAEHGREQPRRHEPERGRLHRQAPGQRVHGAAVLRPGLRAAVRGLRLRRDAVLRRDDDRQPDQNQNTGGASNADCNNYLLGGEEPINWAYVTKSGNSQAPADPLFTGTFTSPHFDAVNPDLTKDLLMNPGDWITIHMHDTAAGFRIDITDETSQSGSMTASSDNGFAHVLSSRTREVHVGAVRLPSRVQHRQPARQHVVGAHVQRRVLRRDRALRALPGDSTRTSTARCRVPTTPTASTTTTSFCVPGSDSLLVQINGCFAGDNDFDGPSYQNDWPGTNPDVEDRPAAAPRAGDLHEPDDERRPRRIRRSPFEADLPAIERRTGAARRDDRSELRQPAAGRAVLSVLLQPQVRRDAAPGRRAGRSSRGRSGTSAAAPRRSTERSSPRSSPSRGSRR